jgi:hypothetical protein
VQDDGAVFLRSKLDDDDGDGNPKDEDYPRIDDEDDDIADHAWARDDRGLYHLFFHTEGQGGGSRIEHYVSADLQSIEYAGVALEPSPGGWDAHNLWAPHVLRHGDTWYLFYTGTTGTGSASSSRQRLGLATSRDLVTWRRWPENRCPGTTGDGCLYECREGWTTWGQAGPYDNQCRDAFVTWDAAARRWVLFATTRHTSGSGVVTVAYSSDLVNWTGAGWIDATRRLPHGAGGQPTGGQAENPFVMTRGGRHYLLFTDWQDPQDSCSVREPRTTVQYATSTCLAADTLGSGHWTYRGYTPDTGVNAIEVQVLGSTWLMSQSIAHETSGDEPEHRRELRLKRMLWAADGTFRTVPWPRLGAGGSR